MNPVTITIQVDPISEDKTHLHAHIAHPAPFWHLQVPKRGVGERTWQGTYQGDARLASLGGIWLAGGELDVASLYKCIVNLKVNTATLRLINDFLWQNPVPEFLDVYEHLRPLLRKHTILYQEESTGILVDSLIEQIGHFWGLRHLRTRLPRAAQLVAMGAVKAVTEHSVPRRFGYEWQVFSQTIPGGKPYSVTLSTRAGKRSWQCNCLDTNPACKHILAVAMQSKLIKGE